MDHFLMLFNNANLLFSFIWFSNFRIVLCDKFLHINITAKYNSELIFFCPTVQRIIIKSGEYFKLNVFK